jgi:hypothetical protein
MDVDDQATFSRNFVWEDEQPVRMIREPNAGGAYGARDWWMQTLPGEPLFAASYA